MAVQFGDYLVQELIGTGGMASVHLAESSRTGTRVALKRLLQHNADDPETVRAFLDEGRLVRQLHHPNIASTYDCGVVEGTYFIAMEYVPGHTLAQLIRRCSETMGIIPFPISVQILIQLCDALDYAHKLCDPSGKPLSIIHRDVSPANVILSNHGIVKLIDFGIAKAASSTVHSNVGVVKGKFSYMAPEYLKGKLDSRVDLWALGVVAHELLTNRRLFLGKNDFESLYKVRADELVPPSRHNPEVPPDFDVIVMTALQREPDLRWQSAGAMRTALANAAAELQTVVTKAQLSDWVEWTFNQEALDEGSELSQLITILAQPRSSVSVVSYELVVPTESTTEAEINEAPKVEIGSQPARARNSHPTDQVRPYRRGPTPAVTRSKSPSIVTARPASLPHAPAADRRKGRALRVFVLLVLLVAAGGYAAWHYGYLPPEVLELLDVPQR